MVPCKHCSTPNSLDSTFCKRCGTGLDEIEIAEAKLKLENIVKEGNTALNEGRLEEAMAVAESSVSTDPSSVAAWSLKASAHERKGEVAEALECAEKIVELNPDSELDKIKRNQLRNALVARAQSNPAGDRRTLLAGVAAVAVMTLVLCATALSMRNKKDSLSAPLVTNAGTYPTLGAIQTGDLSGATGSNTATTPNNASTGTPATSERAAPSKEESPAPATASANELPPPTRGPLPEPKRNDGIGVEIKPVTPDPGSVATVASAGPKSSDPDPVDTARTAAPVPTSPDESEGTIDIQVHRGGKRLPGGSEVVSPTSGGASAYARVGNERFQIGDYAGAASNLERALSSGGDPVGLNLRLGQSYQNLGRKSDATQAFEKCLQAVEASLASGKGNRTRLQATKDSCEAALKIVRGG